MSLTTDGCKTHGVLLGARARSLQLLWSPPPPPHDAVEAYEKQKRKIPLPEGRSQNGAKPFAKFAALLSMFCSLAALQFHINGKNEAFLDLRCEAGEAAPESW